MGRDKARLPFADASLLSRVVFAVRQATGRVIIVVDNPDRLGPGELPLDIGVAVDRYPGTGPLGGLITSLEAAGSGIHIAVACDMPNLNSALLRLLLERADGCDAVVPEV